MKKRFFAFLTVLALFSFCLPAQEKELINADAGEETAISKETAGGVEADTFAGEETATGDGAVAGEESDGTEPSAHKSFFNQLGFFVGFTPSVLINTDSATGSAPSPIFTPLYAGLVWPKENFISFQPALKFFFGYYLVHDDVVYPAEMENRTALALSFLLDLPVAFTLNLNMIHVGQLQVQAGIAALIRIGLLANGVSESDFGYYGTAADDLSYINSWFFGKLRFLYLSGGANWLFTSGKVKFGPEASVYLPIAGFFVDKSMSGIIISAGIKFQI